MIIRIGVKARRRVHISRMACMAIGNHRGESVDLYTLVEETLLISRNFRFNDKPVKEGEAESMLILLLGLTPASNRNETLEEDKWILEKMPSWKKK